MREFFEKLLSTDFMPHGFCLRTPELIRLHAVSDGFISLSYFVIPVALILLVRRRRDLAFRGTFLLFGGFIVACGMTHLLDVITLWYPLYRLEGMVKVITAIASVSTAVLTVKLIPVAVALPSPEQLRREIAVRKQAEEQTAHLNRELEDRVRARTEELASANQRLSELTAALDKTQSIIQTIDGTIIYWNGGAAAMYGWSSQEAVGRNSNELLRKELPASFGHIRAGLLERGYWTGEVRHGRRDGSKLWVASYLVLHRNSRGEPVSVVEMNNDITELKNKTEALRVSAEKIQSLLENASQGILSVGEDGRITDANGMAQKLFGYEASEIVGMPVDCLLPENLRARHREHRAAYAAQPRMRTMGQGLDLTAVRKDGSEFPVEISLSSSRGPDGASVTPSSPTSLHAGMRRENGKY